MPTLLIDNGHDRFGGTFHGPLLIGRRAANAIVIDELAVDLVHAWISHGESGYFVANIATGGRNTFVNGQAVQGRRVLNDGDVIEIGSSTRITFHHHETMPGGYRPVELQWRGTPVANVDEPIVFPCSCGATIRMTPIFSGTMSRCPQCGRVVDVPEESVSVPLDAEPAPPASSAEAEPVPVRAEVAAPAVAVPLLPPVEAAGRAAEMPPAAVATSQPEAGVPQAGTALAAAPVQADVQAIEADAAQENPIQAAVAATLGQDVSAPAVPVSPAPEAAPAARATCGICHSGIEESEETTHCPDCGLVFHFDCWMGNWGCSSYGCSQVNAARPAETHSMASVATPFGEAPAAETADNVLTNEPTTPAPAASSSPSTPALATAPIAAPAPMPLAAGASAPAMVATTPDLDALLKEGDGFPWEFVTLGASVIGLLISALTFGVPSLIVGVIAMLMARRRAIARPGVLFACAFLVALGLLLGLAVSSFWWLGAGPLGVRR